MILSRYLLINIGCHDRLLRSLWSQILLYLRDLTQTIKHYEWSTLLSLVGVHLFEGRFSFKCFPGIYWYFGWWGGFLFDLYLLFWLLFRDIWLFYLDYLSLISLFSYWLMRSYWFLLRLFVGIFFDGNLGHHNRSITDLWCLLELLLDTLTKLGSILMMR